MDFKRRLFLKAFSATAIAFASQSYAQDDAPSGNPELRKDERDVIVQMAKAGYKDFVLLSKKNSKIYLIQDSQFLLQTDIIFGRGKGERNLTPSGAFSLTNLFQGEAKPKMSFYIDDRVIYLIHGVVPGREQAFTKDNMTARQLSDGCINVPDVTLPYVLAFARQKAINSPDHQATPFIVMDEKYSPAQFAKTIKTFTPEKYNPN